MLQNVSSTSRFSRLALAASLTLGVLVAAQPAGSTSAADPAAAPAADEINGVVWNDLNADGVNDATESGLVGQEVTLYDAAGNAAAQMVTGADGLYSFTGLNAADGPFRVSVTRDAATYSDPANWIASSASHPNYVGTDQDFTTVAGGGIPVANATGVVPGTQLDAAIRPRPELSIGPFGPGVIDGGGDFNTAGNCASPTDIAQPGDDCGDSNGQIRSQDVLSTVWSVTADNFEPGTTDWGPVMFEQTIVPAADDPATPQDESAVDAIFEGIPLSCQPPPSGSGGATPASQIIDNPDGGQTLICNLGQFDEGAQKSLTVPIKVLGTSQNKSEFSTTQSVYVDGDRAVPAVAPETGPFEVSAAPLFDLEKMSFRYNHPTTRCIDDDENTATPCVTMQGYYTYFLIRLASEQSTGIEAIEQPFSFKDNITAVGADGITPYVPDFYMIECRANPSGWGDTVLGRPFGRTEPDPYYYRTASESGDCSFTRDDPSDPTSQYTFTIDNADLSGERFPTKTWGGQDLSAGPFIYAEHRVMMFVPLQSIEDADGNPTNQNGSFQMSNQFGGFDPNGVSGTSNFGDGFEPGYCPADFSSCDTMADGTASNNGIGPITMKITPPGGARHKYVWYRINTSNSSYTRIGNQSSNHSGNGIMEPGDANVWQVRFQSTGSTGLVNPTVCDVFDRTTTLLTLGDRGRNAGPVVPADEYAFVSRSNWSTSRAEPWQDNFVVEYGAIDMGADDPLYNAGRVGQPSVIDSTFFAGTDTYSTTTSRFEGDWSTQSAANCDDASSAAGWYTDPNDPALGGIDNVNAVRARPVDPTFTLEPSEYLTLNTVTETRSNFVGGPHDGEAIPPGTVQANFSNVRADNWNTNGGVGNWAARSYTPSPESTHYDGDRTTIARFTTRLQKRTLQPLTDVGRNGATLAGNQIVWELIPAVSATVVPSSSVAENVVIYDVLPPHTTYNAACTAALNNDPATETIMPSLVEPHTDMNGPATDYTKLTYILGDVPANDPIPRIRLCTDTNPIAPNGTQVDNYTELNADDDITHITTRSDTHGIILEQNGSAQISKSVDRSLDPTGDDQNWTIEYSNFAAAFELDPTVMIDVLPWNGDGLGSANERDPASDFTPTSTLEMTVAPTVTFSDGSVPGAGDPHAEIAEITYTADSPDTVDYNPDENTSTWCSQADFGTAGCPATLADVTAFRVASNYPLARDGNPRQGHRVDFTLQATGNSPGDAYTNRATLDSASLPPEQFLRSNNVIVEVAGFNLGDVVFSDVNRNGVYDPGVDDPAPEGVDLQLFRSGDINPIKTTSTDENGRYLFSGFGSGDYYVVIPDSEFGAGGLLEGWTIDPVGVQSDPNTDENDNVDHHAIGITPGTTDDGVRSTGVVTLSATIPASPLANPTGDEPLGDNTAGLATTVGDDFTNLTVDLGLIAPIVPGIHIEKSTNGSDADTAPGVYVGEGGEVTWTYVVTNTGDTGIGNVTVEDDQEGTATYVDGDTDGDDILDLDETWTFQLTGTATAGQYSNEGTVTGVAVDPTGTPIPGVDPVEDDDPSHYTGLTTGIEIIKTVQTYYDANDAPGPRVAAGGAVKFVYTVTNTGTSTLNDVSVTDSVIGNISCPFSSLAPGEQRSCVAVETGTAGDYVNTGTATGNPVDPDGNELTDLTDPTDEDDAHYFGANPVIDIEKFVQTDFDADTPTGPLVAADGTVKFTYVVTNTGNVDLTDVEVTDDIEGDITCPQDTLAVGESMTCELSGIDAVDSGQYTNTGTATGTGPWTIGPNGEVLPGDDTSDTDDANYFSVVPDVDIQKFVQTSFDANDSGTVPTINEGDTVRFRYVVTNTGNTVLNNITVTDDIEGDITCPQDTLAIGESMTCTLDAIAVGGNYTNVGTVTATGPDTVGEDGQPVPGTEVDDSDPASYSGSNPSVDIIKKVQTDFDADTAPGPLVDPDGSVRWTYEVTNTGNVALTNVTVTDNRFDDDSIIDCGRGAANVIPALAEGASVTCVAIGDAIVGPYNNTGSVVGTGPDTIDFEGNPVPGATVEDEDDANYFGAEPAIDIEKSVQTDFDADTPTGPLVAADGTVKFTYVVTNSGNVDLTNVAVTDDIEGDITCPQDTLAVGESMTCELSGIDAVDAGQYTNTGTATGTGPSTIGPNGEVVPGDDVDDTDDANYLSIVPAIDIVKYVQTVHDSNTAATAPVIEEGNDVLFTYVVTNTGNSVLNNVAVVDDVEGAITCPQDTLAVDESMTCELLTTATAGDYTNLGSVTAVGPETYDEDGSTVPGVAVDDDDPANYLGITLGIDIEKFVQDDADADTAPGPLVAVGDEVKWTYVVTNTGTADLNNVTVTDDQIDDDSTIDCGLETNNVIEVLEAGQSITCTATGTATEGQYTNTGTATGVGPETVGPDGEPVPGTEVDDEDDANYFGSGPSIDIEKSVQTNFDADEPVGPAVAPGGDVKFTYVVTNTGNVDLVDVAVSDDIEGDITCPATELAVDESMTCEIVVSAIDGGEYSNTGSATGTGPETVDNSGEPVAGIDVDDEDKAHYWVPSPSIDIETYVNHDHDADDPNGPTVDPDSDVEITYVVTTPGDTPISDVVVNDSQWATEYGSPTYVGGDTNGDGLLDPDETWTYTLTVPATGTTAAASTGDVTGIGPITIDADGNEVDGVVVDDVDAHHFQSYTGGIEIEKATNGDDADDAPGPVVPAGSDVEWTYVVTNTGTSALRNVTVVDNPAEVIDCGDGSNLIALLLPGAEVTCTAQGTAASTSYENVATATGEAVAPPAGVDPDVDPTDPSTWPTDPSVYVPVLDPTTQEPMTPTDDDPSHHHGVTPGVTIEKSTNGADSDIAPGDQITENAPITWTYVVTNSGDTAMTDITVSDDQGVTVTCPGGSNTIDFLAPGESETCTGTGTAELGQYRNVGTVTGTAVLPDPETCDCDLTDPSTWPTDPSVYVPLVDPSGEQVTVEADDPSHYVGVARNWNGATLPQTGGTSTTPSRGTLPVTGSSIVIVLSMAVMLLIAGSTLRLASRRRRQRQVA